MAAKQYEKAPQFTTPRGPFQYPKLSEPDYGKGTKFPNENGEYKVKMIFDRDDPAVQALLQKLAPLHDVAISEGKAKFSELKVDARKKLEKVNGPDGVQVNDLYKILYDETTEEETGKIEMGFKMQASGVSQKTGKTWRRSPGLFDGFMQPIPAGTEIWSGTVGKVNFSTRPYFVASSGAVGLSLKLEAAQIIDLVSAGTRSAESYGFGEEGGFSADDLPKQPVADTNDADAGSDGVADDASDAPTVDF